MIITKLSGGLGNQLFQYALARQLAYQHNTEVKLDVSLYKNPPKESTKRNFELQNLHINAEIAQQEEIDKIKRKNLKGVFKSIYWRTQYLKPYYKQNLIKEQSCTFDKDILNSHDNIYLEGYWQSAKYFPSIREILLTDFRPKVFGTPEENDYMSRIKNSNSISIHIRRGDYITNPKHKEIYKTISSDYYFQAMDFLNEKVKNPVFFIFSDDMNWVKSIFNIKNYNITFVEIDNAVSCMHLMTNCMCNIIANSTFGWWGAWLNQNKNKVVVSPKEWFTVECKLKTDDLIPKEWIKK